MLSEEWNFLKMRVSEICVKRICVNQELGVSPLLQTNKQVTNPGAPEGNYYQPRSAEADAR